MDLICCLADINQDAIREFIIGDQISYDFLVFLKSEGVIGIEINSDAIYVASALTPEKLPFPKELHQYNHTVCGEPQIRRIVVP